MAPKSFWNHVQLWSNKMSYLSADRHSGFLEKSTKWYGQQHNYDLCGGCHTCMSTESNVSASYLDLLLSIERYGQLRTSLYDKRDDFNIHITNRPLLSSNIPSSPAYGVFISQLIRYARDCSSYECFILRAARLSCKLLGQRYVMERLKSSLRMFYGRYGDRIKHYEVPSPKCYMTFWDMIIYSDTLHWSDISLIMTLLPN